MVKRGGALGDLILTLPAIAALRLAFPDLPLAFIGDPRFFPLVCPDAALDQDSPGLTPFFGGADPSPEARPFFSGSACCLAYAVDPDGHLGGQLRRLVPGRLMVWDPRPPAGRHITDHLLTPLRQHGIAVADPLPRVALPPEEVARARDHLHGSGPRSPLVLIHPGSGGRRKCWPLDRYLELAGRCAGLGCRVLLLHGPAEVDLGAQLHQDPRWGEHTLAPPGLLALAGLLANASLFIGNDSGPGHLAAALGTPTLTLFGPTDPQVWRPPHPWSRVLRAPAGQLAELGVPEVRAAVEQLLEDSPGPER